MNKKGFTLVELMVVIVIIGVLAAVAIPKMMAATNKAKAGEGPQLLRSIASMEAAFKAENDTYIAATQGTQGAAEGAWKGLGFDQNPFSRYFEFDVGADVEYAEDGVYESYADSFGATAKLKAALGSAASGATLGVDQSDERTGGVENNQLTELGKLVPNWR